MIHYNIFYDKSVVIISIITILLIIALPVVFYFLSGKKINTLLIIVSLSLYIPIIITFLYAPKKYVIDNNTISIKKIVGNISFNKNKISTYKELNITDLGSMTRTFASGGLFGYFGSFRSSKIGDLSVYCGSLNSNLILITLKSNKKFLISPDNKDKFMAALNQ